MLHLHVLNQKDIVGVYLSQWVALQTQSFQRFAIEISRSTQIIILQDQVSVHKYLCELTLMRCCQLVPNLRAMEWVHWPTLLLNRTRFSIPGQLVAKSVSIIAILFPARSNVLSLLSSGRDGNVVISLSVRSIVPNWSFVEERFSTYGIL